MIAVAGARRGLAAAGTGLGLALFAALPLVVAHVAGASGPRALATRSAILVVDAEGATAALADGSARTALPWLQPGDHDIAVSPSGRRLAFTSERAGNRELYAVDIATGELDRLTWSPRREDVEPAWSPDGSTLVWASGTATDHDLYRMRFDRTRVRKLTRGEGDDREPTWAPDGRTIAFASDRQGSFDLWTVAAHGGTPELLLDPAGDARAPDWHPSGERLAYTGIVAGAADVWVADASGSTRRLVASRDYEGRPDWSPDGRFVGFVRGSGGTLRPWLTRAGGGSPRPLAGAPQGAEQVVWGLLHSVVAPARSTRLPDLDQRPPADLVVRSAASGRFLLGFTSATDNLGDGPLWLRGRRTSARGPMLVEQLVERRGGSVVVLRGAGRLRYELHPPHRHWHLDDFVRYELRRLDGSLVVRDRKSGFCLVDRWGLARHVAGRKPALPRFVGDCGTLRPEALAVEEGSSVGYTDRYPAFFHGQDLDLTGMRAGLYELVQRANPERGLRELDYGNNAASLLLRLSWPAGRSLPPRIDVLRTCAGSDRCVPRPAK